MSSGGGGFGSTLTNGVQSIAAILPLLGTEQCSIHVSSALTRGYLYAAAAPMSIFGSLGVVSAGFKTMVACFSFGGFEGADLLENMGFEPQGENLSLIMFEGGKGKSKGRYIIENRIDALIDELSIDRNRVTGVSHKSAPWNIKMMVATALLCALSIAPYIYINLVANNLDLKRGTIWVFPILRSTGGFITATLIQLLIQRRITTLSHQYLVKRDQLSAGDGDVEAVVGVEKTKYQVDAPTWSLLFLLLIGLLASVVGYVGCFSIVQNSASSLGPVSWLCLELGLSVVRLAIWASNPRGDDAPPLEIYLELDKYEPLPTCNTDDAEILRSKVLPLTRARDFLKSITSFVGLIKPFSNPDLSLYYTMTRKRAYKGSGLMWFKDNEPWDTERHRPGERALYITVFDHKERTTRVYTRDNEVETLYSTKSDAPLVDVGHFILEVEIDAEIDSKGDPLLSGSNNLDSLRKHHRSILEHIQFRLGAGDITDQYAIKNSWSMKADDTISTLHRLREGIVEAVVEKGGPRGEDERNYELVASDYFMHSSIEKERRLLDEDRGKWIARRMEMIAQETKERLSGMGVENRVDKKAVEKKPGAKSPEEMLGWEQYYMEQLLVCEVREWEELFWNKFKAFLVKIGNDRVEETERLTREWRANCWRRLNPQRHAALKRFADVDDMKNKDWFLKNLGKQWALSIGQLFDRVENPVMSLSDLRRSIGDEDDDEMGLRLEKEIEDIEFRLKRGSDMGRFDQFWNGDSLFYCRYSRSKWVFLNQRSTAVTAPPEVFSHALKGNKNIVHIIFGYMDSDFDANRFLCDIPWVTSISPSPFKKTIATIHRDILFIKSTNNDLNTFAKEIKLVPSSTYIFSDAGFLDVYSGKLGRNARVLISFVAPTSGKSLTLRVKHSESGEKDPPLEVTLGSTKIQLNPPSKSSLTIDDITLYSIEVSGTSESDHLSFVPEVRNAIFIRFTHAVPHRYHDHGHFLHDIELLDEAGLEYMPHLASISKLSN